MVTGYNQDDWDRLMDADYDRPPSVSDVENMDNTLYMGDVVEPRREFIQAHAKQVQNLDV